MNDPVRLLDVCRGLRVEGSERLPGGMSRHTGRVVPHPSALQRILRREPAAVALEVLLGEDGALREVRGTRAGRTRALIVASLTAR